MFPPPLPLRLSLLASLLLLRVLKLATLVIFSPTGSLSQVWDIRTPRKHTLTLLGACNTREVVLARDGTNVVQDSSCAATSGTWKSPYDGATWTAASDVDIDHMVPLSNAWKVSSPRLSSSLSVLTSFQSGASSWTTARRQAFANDLTNPQLLAVTDNVNQAKGDKGPEDWKPPLTSYYCTYAKMWVKVKSVYSLTITSAEKTALTSMLNTC